MNQRWTMMNHDEPAMNQRWTTMNQFLIFSGIFAEKWNILRNCSSRWQMKMKVWNRSWKNFFLAMPQKFDEPVMNQQWTSNEPWWTSNEPAMNQRWTRWEKSLWKKDFLVQILLRSHRKWRKDVTRLQIAEGNYLNKEGEKLDEPAMNQRWTSDEPHIIGDEP